MCLHCTKCIVIACVYFVAGASLVQWNKSNGNVLASAHDSDVRIWDMKVCTLACHVNYV